MNNKMCIDKDKECPINMLIYKNTTEPPTEYNYTFKNVSFDDGSYLYYTNEAIVHHILGRFRISDGKICINPFTNGCKLAYFYRVFTLIYYIIKRTYACLG